MKITALKVAELDTIRPCVVNNQGFSKDNGEIKVKTDKLFNYVFLIEKKDVNILVDTGLKDVEVMNEPTLEMFKGVMLWHKNEEDRLDNRLAERGLSSKDIDYLILTHFHYDHCSNTDLFPEAKVIFHKKSWLNVICPEFSLDPFYPRHILAYIVKHWDRVILTEDDKDILPGISMHWLGGHDNGCAAVTVKTKEGNVVLTSDVIQVYDNLEIPVGVNYNVEECLRAMDWVKDNGDIIIPSHEPELMEKFPEGRII